MMANVIRKEKFLEEGVNQRKSESLSVNFQDGSRGHTTIKSKGGGGGGGGSGGPRSSSQTSSLLMS